MISRPGSVITDFMCQKNAMPTSTKLVHEAIDLSDSEDYLGALSLLTQAVATDPNNAQAYFERGMALLNLDRDAEAVPDFDRALSINTSFPGARDWRSRAMESLGDHQSAADDRLVELQAHPDGPYEGAMGVCPLDWSDCAGAFINAGNVKKARELLEEYFNSYVSKVTDYACHETAPMRMLANLLLQDGNSDRAVTLAHDAYNSDHKCPMDVLVYALALESAGDLVGAQRICDEAISDNDEMPGVKELVQRLAN